MVAVKLSVYIGEDRRVTIQLPDEVPVGPAELTIQPSVIDAQADPESLKKILRAAGVIREAGRTSEAATELSLEERLRIGKLPPGARPSEELVNEDRGEW